MGNIKIYVNAFPRGGMCFLCLVILFPIESLGKWIFSPEIQFVIILHSVVCFIKLDSLPGDCVMKFFKSLICHCCYRHRPRLESARERVKKKILAQTTNSKFHIEIPQKSLQHLAQFPIKVKVFISHPPALTLSLHPTRITTP